MNNYFKKYFEMAVNFKENDKRVNKTPSIIRSLLNKIKRANIDFQIVRKKSGEIVFPEPNWVQDGKYRRARETPLEPFKINDVVNNEVAFVVHDINDVHDVKIIIKNYGNEYPDFDFDVTIERRDDGTIFDLKVSSKG